MWNLVNGPHVSVFLGLSCLEIVYYLECQNLSDLHLGFLSPSVTFKLMLYRKKCEGKVCLSLFFFRLCFEKQNHLSRFCHEM